MELREQWNMWIMEEEAKKHIGFSQLYYASLIFDDEKIDELKKVIELTPLRQGGNQE